MVGGGGGGIMSKSRHLCFISNNLKVFSSDIKNDESWFQTRSVSSTKDARWLLPLCDIYNLQKRRLQVVETKSINVSKFVNLAGSTTAIYYS